MVEDFDFWAWDSFDCEIQCEEYYDEEQKVDEDEIEDF